MAQAVQGLADRAPPDWRKIIYDLEFLEDEEIGLRNTFTGRALGGEQFDIRLDGYQIGMAPETFEAVQAMYQASVQLGETRAGILVTLFCDGQFKCRFFYENTPLLDGNEAGLAQIMAEGMNDLPSRPIGPA